MKVEEVIAGAFMPLMQKHDDYRPGGGGGKKTKPVEKEDALNVEARQIAEHLIEEAYRHGLATTPNITNVKHASDGSIANTVAFTTTSVGFVLKVDKGIRLSREARKLMDIQNRDDLPPAYKDLYPKVYAAKLDESPYGYLMERIEFKSFKEFVFIDKADKSEIERILNEIVSKFFLAYEHTKDIYTKPNLVNIYIDRIERRISDASSKSNKLKTLCDVGVVVNQETYKPLSHYLDKVVRSLDSMCPGFTTFVHGDSHMENVLVDGGGIGEWRIRLIDPSEWAFGDYMFDFGKLFHYLVSRGPIISGNASKSFKYTKGKCPEIVYDLGNRIYLDSSLSIKGRLKTFSKQMKDDKWEQRYHLSMAANLLGGCEKRIDAKKEDQALQMYCEGIRHLKLVCDLG